MRPAALLTRRLAARPLPAVLPALPRAARAVRVLCKAPRGCAHARLHRVVGSGVAMLLRHAAATRGAPPCPRPCSEKEAHNRAVVLEMIGDLPEADAKPPPNMLFICKLNPVGGRVGSSGCGVGGHSAGSTAPCWKRRCPAALQRSHAWLWQTLARAGSDAADGPLLTAVW